MQNLPLDASPADTLLRAWTDAFNASDLAAIVALYADDALLWGTTAQAVIGEHAGIEAYFAAVFALRPAPRVELTSAVTRRHADTVLVAGTYTLELATLGTAVRSPARYSFTLRRQGAQWRIALHHSSMLPAGPAMRSPGPG